MKLPNWKNFQTLHMYCTLFLPQGIENELMFALWAEVSEIEAIFKITLFGHETLCSKNNQSTGETCAERQCSTGLWYILVSQDI